jgi:hypothetical protein
MVRARNVLRAARQSVMRHHWHEKPVIGGSCGGDTALTLHCRRLS